MFIFRTPSLFYPESRNGQHIYPWMATVELCVFTNSNIIFWETKINFCQWQKSTRLKYCCARTANNRTNWSACFCTSNWRIKWTHPFPSSFSSPSPPSNQTTWPWLTTRVPNNINNQNRRNLKSSSNLRGLTLFFLINIVILRHWDTRNIIHRPSKK